MTTAAVLIKEIETLPEESLISALDFISFLKNRPFASPKRGRISAYGVFKDLKGMDTAVEREDWDGI